ncbi:MAG: hypothetical protein SFX74_01765 [Fimbriimonadaceae bacterium]|nr:hypothetical protein [Fimbriimonadaceae bacterium]
MTFLEKISAKEDNLLAIGAAWTVGMLWFTTGGFYLGTIIGSDHKIDLQVPLVSGPGVVGMLVSIVVGAIVATLVTIIYPKVTASDDAAHDDHGHVEASH